MAQENRWKGFFQKEKKEEKVKTAVAIAYNPGDAAPKILATGKGECQKEDEEDM